MKDEYLSIAEFAKRAGVTKQAVYLRLNKDLKPYLNELDGKKCLNIKALELYDIDPLEKDASSTIIDLMGHLEKQYELLSHLVDVLEADNAKLHAELDIKNKQLLESNERQRELSIMLDQQQKLNAQALLTGSTQAQNSSPVDQEEIDAAYQKGQAALRDELQAKIDEANEKGRLESLRQYELGYKKGQADEKDRLQAAVKDYYDKGYKKGKSDESEKLAKLAKALVRKYPDAADYIIDLFDKGLLEL